MHIFFKQPFLIADLGFNFYDIAVKENISQLDAIKLMIREAKNCGVDGVNVDLFNEDSTFSVRLSHDVSSKDSDAALLEDLDDFGKAEYEELSDFCKEIGISFFVSPCDIQSVDDVDKFVDYYSIPSSDLTNIPLIKHIASKNKPILLSTGASTLREIKKAVSSIEEVSTVDIAILHSVMSFPTSFEDANLLMIKDLAANFKEYDIGYSDHAKADKNMFLLTTAFNYGAIILEKHFTLDKTLNWGDHPYSMDPDDVRRFKDNVNFIFKINGYKNKQPLICESFMKNEFRKSIVAIRDIKKGEIIKESDLDYKRPGTGISPDLVDDVIGKKTDVNISKNSLISFEMLSD